MGEATYYLKTRFPGTLDKEKQREIRDFLVECGKAYAYWQGDRSRTPRAFWPEFRTKFPQVCDYFRQHTRINPDNNNQDNNNAIAGTMSIGNSGDEYEIDDALAFNEDENGDTIMTYSEYTWHLADWTPVVSYISARWGAKRSDWVSDEYANILDMMDV